MREGRTFFDTGASGTWADAIRHSPVLCVVDYEPRQNTLGNNAKGLGLVSEAVHEGRVTP